MLSLIAREIRDNVVSVALPCLVGLIIIALTIWFGFFRMGGGLVVPWVMLTPLLLVTLCGLGSSQMYSDRAHRISSLLATQGVTRNRILAARILVGVLTALAAVLPAAVVAVIALWLILPLMPLFAGLITEIAVTLLLAAVACHGTGLLVGWTTSRAWLLAGNLLLVAFVIALVAIKGFGPDVMGLLALFIGATWLRTWHKFSSASL